MKEEVMAKIWSKFQFELKDLKTTEGKDLEILALGKENKDSGADFQNAKIRIDGVIWVGSVELHVRSSDWLRHRHNKDRAYENVILHVVWKRDGPINHQNGEAIPELELSRFVDLEMVSLYDHFKFIPCENLIGTLEKETLTKIFRNLILERFNKKSEEINLIFQENLHDLEGTFYQILGRVFGLPLNALPMEILLKMIPQKLVMNYRDNQEKLEALFLGMGGFLEEEMKDDYYEKLKKEFSHFKNKYQIQGKYLQRSDWKFSKTRPGNFPGPRIGQFIQFITEKISIVSFIISIENFQAIKKMTEFKLEGYWADHFDFGKSWEKHHQKSSQFLSETILINAIAPMLYFYGLIKNQKVEQDRAVNLLIQTKAEKNYIIRGYEELGIKASTALETQALYFLKKNYCDKKKCLVCALGKNFFRS